MMCARRMFGVPFPQGIIVYANDKSSDNGMLQLLNARVCAPGRRLVSMTMELFQCVMLRQKE